ncbi:MAG: GNAT family N-acetyltransferase [Thioalkalivibrio sp.]
MQQSDFPAVYELVKSTEVLDVHTPYTYWVLLNQASNLSFVARRPDCLAGFITGMGPFRACGEAFVWQIGVHPELLRQGIGRELLGHFVDAAHSRGFNSICTTISENNQASLGLFAQMARALGQPLERETSTGTMGALMLEEILYRIRLA